MRKKVKQDVVLEKTTPQKISLRDLKNRSNVSRAQVKTISWEDPESGDTFEAEICIRKHSFKTYHKLIASAAQAEDKHDDVLSQVKSLSALVLSCVFEDEDATIPFFKNEDEVMDTEPTLIYAMVFAVREVNERKKKD